MPKTGDEHRGDAIGHPLQGGLVALSLFDQSDDACEQGLGTDGRDFHDDPRRAIDRAAMQVVSRLAVQGQGFASQHGDINLGLTFAYESVCGNALTAEYHQTISHPDFR